MSDYIIAKLPGGLYFFTVVTFERRNFLTSNPARHILREVWKEVQQNTLSGLKRSVCCPTICTASGGCRQTIAITRHVRWRLIKSMFSRRYLRTDGQEGMRNRSRQQKKEVALWQRRYLRLGYYDDEWGCGDRAHVEDNKYGE